MQRHGIAALIFPPCCGGARVFRVRALLVVLWSSIEQLGDRIGTLARQVAQSSLGLGVGETLNDLKQFFLRSHPFDGSVRPRIWAYWR
jgi:hypothetical protein